MVDRLVALRHDYDATCRAVSTHASTAASAGRIRDISAFEDVASFDEYCWARSIIASRNFGLDVPVPVPRAASSPTRRKNGSKRDATATAPQMQTQTQTALVPFGDMLNHARPRRTRWSFAPSTSAADPGPGHFVMTAERPLAAGSEVLGSYGQKSNARYLLNYGFTFPTNVLTPDDVRPAFACAAAAAAATGPATASVSAAANASTSTSAAASVSAASAAVSAVAFASGGGSDSDPNAVVVADTRTGSAAGPGEGAAAGELRCLDEVRLFFQLSLDDPSHTLKVSPTPTCHGTLHM